MNKFPILFILLLLLSYQGHSQTFKAGIIGGFTASQINGDDSAGYNKLGLEGGLTVGIELQEKMDLSLEILYSQRGAKEEVDVDGTPQSIYRANFISVPVVFSYKDWLGDNYYRLHFHGGLSYGRLVSGALENDLRDNSRFVSTWNENDLSFLLGATYFVNENFGLTFRYNRSLFLLFEAGSTATFEVDGVEMTETFNTNSLLPFNLSFHALYMF
jgi:hypothetical protein